MQPTNVPFYKSPVVLSAIAMILLALLGVDVDSPDVQQLVRDNIVNITNLILGVITLIGRVNATQTVIVPGVTGKPDATLSQYVPPAPGALPDGGAAYQLAPLMSAEAIPYADARG